MGVLREDGTWSLWERVPEWVRTMVVLGVKDPRLTVGVGTEGSSDPEVRAPRRYGTQGTVDCRLGECRVPKRICRPVVACAEL